ncbi:MAG: hypothetical protein QXE32_05870 [Sulfolobales archaeon]
MCKICRRNLSIASCPACGRTVCYKCLVEEGFLKTCAICKISGLSRRFLATYLSSRLKRK